MVDGLDTSRIGSVLCGLMEKLLEDKSVISSADEAIYFHSFCLKTV